jgi:hypothetical protein
VRTRDVVTTMVATVAAAVPATAGAAPVTRDQAVRVAKRAASQKAASLGLTLPRSEWTAACYRAGHGRWRCEAGAGQGYCSASMRVSGSDRHPRAGRVRVFCLE